MLDKTIVIPTISLKDTEEVDFYDLFRVEDVQRLQDDFAKATGVASIITEPNGTPITRPINFCRLCNDIIRKTEKGLANCYLSDAAIGSMSQEGPIIQPCLSGGMMDAGAAISVGGKHIATWLIGQVRSENQTEEMIREYALQIGADIDDTVEAFRETPVMPKEQFKQIAQALFTFANQLSTTAYQSVLQTRFIEQSKRAKEKKRRLEHDYQALFREMMDGFSLHHIICNEHGQPVDYRFIDVNPSFERMTGLTREDILGKTVLEVLPKTESQWIEKFGHVALTGEPAFFENYSAELDTYFAVTAYQPVANQFVCIFSDITHRKKAEQEHARFTADLANKNQELEQMVYAVSHDLRSPLVNIDGYSRELDFSLKDLERILEGTPTSEIPKAMAPFLEEDIPEAIRFIRSSAAKMDTLLTGLLRLSRTGRTTVHIESLDMNNLISSVVDVIDFQIKKEGVAFKCSDLPPCLGDAAQLNQVFSNLLQNAMKYLDPERSGIIKVSGRVEGEQSVYCIEDNGIGMGSTHVNKIFDIFHQLNPTESSGEGLGLTIVRRIMDRVNGQVWTESAPGIGSSFFVALPHGQGS
jgi:PAS domain S-box-containing protein